MSSVTLTFNRSSGPLIKVAVGVSKPLFDVMMANGQTPPPMVTGSFLIDTGASCTCVDPQFVAPLGLAPSGQTAILTPTTAGVPHNCNLYDIFLFIPGPAGSLGHIVDALQVTESNLRPQGIDGLLGRDVLGNCVLTYLGTAGLFSLAW